MEPRTYEAAVALRHELHMHPELSNQETWTKAHLMEFLRAHTKLELVDRGTWFYAAYRTDPSKPKIAFRADFDAIPVAETMPLPYASTIPGVSHKCGHDGHSASLAALAMEIERVGSENNVFFVFQHAEENGSGAMVCASMIKEEGVDEIYAYHIAPGIPFGSVATTRGNFSCASTGMSIYFTGTPAHACNPGAGRSPAQAIARMVRAIPDIHRAEDYKGFVLCTLIQIDVGEKAFGTAASKGVLRLTLRGSIEDEMWQMRDRLILMAHAMSAEYGLQYSVEYEDYFPENPNHPEQVDKVCRACEKLEIPVELFTLPVSGSEDFGYFTKETAGAYFYIGAGDIPEIHTSLFDFPDGIIKPAVAIFMELAGTKQ